MKSRPTGAKSEPELRRSFFIPERDPASSISFRRLVYEALPEMWTFQILTALLLAVLSFFLTGVINGVAGSGSATLTSANWRSYLINWRSPILLLLGIALLLCYLIIEVFAQIHLTGDILSGEKVSTLGEIKKGIRSLRLFWNPAGILVLVFIFFAVPLCGIGYSVSLTGSFYVPNFIMDVILQKILFSVLYFAAMIVLAWIAYRSAFTLHGVLLDGKSPLEAQRESSRIVKQNRKRFIKSMLKTALFLVLLMIIVQIFVNFIPGVFLELRGAELPREHRIDLERIAEEELFTQTDISVIGYRTFSAVTVLLGGYIYYVTVLLGGSYLMLKLTRCYLEYTGRDTELWPERPRRSLYRWKVILMIVVSVFVLFAALIVGVVYDQVFDRTEPVLVIAHRAGGTLAPENSLEGLEAAIAHECYGSEIDVQRTKDGYYIINHDNTFKRVAGVNKAPGEMTLAEIRKLRIRGADGTASSVVTLEEMLDVIRGKEKLFVEMKGAGADRKMVDDLVRIIREKDCEDDCVLISLNYELIDYAETNYPEFETGTLFFFGLGDVSKLNCDLLIMEEEAASENRINGIHEAGKKAVVWTVNKEEGMLRFLDSEADAIITDEVELAEEVQQELDERTEYRVLLDRLGDFWD